MVPIIANKQQEIIRAITHKGKEVVEQEPEYHRSDQYGHLA